MKALNRRAAPKMHGVVTLLTLSIGITVCPFAFASTRYVSQRGMHMAPFTSWETAATNIQGAVDAATGGDTVLVTNGTYVLSSQIEITNGITVVSVSGAEFTIVDGNDSTRCFFVSHSNAVVGGVTIQRGHGYFPGGGGVLNGGGTVQDCVIRENFAYYGGGVYGGGTIRNCTISGNDAYFDGGGVYLTGTGTVQNCTISGNKASSGGGMECREGTTVQNCIITGNTADGFEGNGGGVAMSWGGTIRNCTISGNTAHGGGGGLFCLEGGTVLNSIIYSNSAPKDSNVQNLWNEGWSYKYCCTTPAVPGDGNITDDPQFADASYGQFMLLPTSSCIDVGTNQAWMTGTTDYAGMERLSGGLVDIGAYEYHPAEELLCNFRAGAREGVIPLSVSFAAFAEGDNANGLYYWWDFDDDGVAEMEGMGLVEVTHVYEAIGRYAVSLTVSNVAGEIANVTKPEYVISGPVVTYVSSDGLHQHPFTDWATAAASIQAAVDVGVNGTVVLVTNGVYLLSSQIEIGKGITVVSVNGAESATVDGNDSTRCFSLSHSNAVVSGFTIQHGGGGDPHEGEPFSGAGVALWAGTLQHCIVRGNSGGYGGGVYCNLGSTVRYCTISGNMAHSGGGIYCGGGGTVQNCSISGNSARHRGGGSYCGGGSTLQNCTITGNTARQGAGVSCGSGGTVQNCTITGNTAEMRVGGLYCNQDGMVLNSIIRYNSAPEDADYQNEGEGWSYTHCCTTPAVAGEGNIDVDPRMTPALRLKADSLCIDAGSSSNAPPTDMDGEARWDHPDLANIVSIVDIGADEFVDTDGDDMADHWETEHFGNLGSDETTDNDVDGGPDGLGALGEYELGTDPTTADTDEDLLTDGQEVVEGTDPLSEDTDTDGQWDGAEVIAGTNPLDVGDYLALEHTSCDPVSGLPVISWLSVTGRLYTVSVSADLDHEEWAPVPDYVQVPGTGLEMSYTILNPTAMGCYRIEVRLGEVPRDMVLIPAGSFEMGDSFNEGRPEELPVHTVYVSAFYMDQFEVTNDKMVEVLQWAYDHGKLTATPRSVRNAQGDPQQLLDVYSDYCRITFRNGTFDIKPDDGSGYPCVKVTWYGTVAYCNYRSEMEGRTPCYDLSDWTCDWITNGYRLPTEAEWEKAARGGLSGERFPWGDTINHSHANYVANNSYPYDDSPYPTNTHHWHYWLSPVGSFQPNGYGLYNLAGNVREWCWDRYDSEYYGSSPGLDPRGPSSGSIRVQRGGHWDTDAFRSRVAFRRGQDGPDIAGWQLGFRTVLRLGQ